MVTTISSSDIDKIKLINNTLPSSRKTLFTLIQSQLGDLPMALKLTETYEAACDLFSEKIFKSKLFFQDNWSNDGKDISRNSVSVKSVIQRCLIQSNITLIGRCYQGYLDEIGKIKQRFSMDLNKNISEQIQQDMILAARPQRSAKDNASTALTNLAAQAATSISVDEITRELDEATRDAANAVNENEEQKNDLQTLEDKENELKKQKDIIKLQLKKLGADKKKDRKNIEKIKKIDIEITKQKAKLDQINNEIKQNEETIKTLRKTLKTSDNFMIKLRDKLAELSEKEQMARKRFSLKIQKTGTEAKQKVLEALTTSRNWLQGIFTGGGKSKKKTTKKHYRKHYNTKKKQIRQFVKKTKINRRRVSKQSRRRHQK